MPSLDDFADQVRDEARKAAQERAAIDAHYRRLSATAQEITMSISRDFLNRLRAAGVKPQVIRGFHEVAVTREIPRGLFKKPDVRTSKEWVEREVTGYRAGSIVVSTQGTLFLLGTSGSASDKDSRTTLVELAEHAGRYLGPGYPGGKPLPSVDEFRAELEPILLRAFGQALAEYVPQP